MLSSIQNLHFYEPHSYLLSFGLIIEPVSFIIRLSWMLFRFIRLIANDPIVTYITVGTCVLTDQHTIDILHCRIVAVAECRHDT